MQRGSGRNRGPDRLSAAGPSLLRARRAGDGDRLQGGLPAQIRRSGGRRGGRQTDSDRPLPRRRGRAGCRLHQRRPHLGDRRNHGTRGTGGNPFGRLGERDSADDAGAGTAGEGAQLRPRLRKRAARLRPHEHAACSEGWRDLHHRSESARLEDGSLRQQGDRGSAGRTGRALHGGRNAGIPGLHPGGEAAVYCGEGSGRTSTPPSGRR